jgi:hypothetical protein
MVLMVRDSSGARFFVLSHDRREDRPPYSLRLRRTTAVVDIKANGGVPIPDVVVNAVKRGVPIPRDGSLFGWRRGDVITALVPVYSTPTPSSPEPFWAVMPRAGNPEAEWPPFTEERLFDQWFWEYYRAGKMVSVDGLIAGTPNTVFWTNTKATLGSDCCAVACDIRSPEGYTLQRGRYMYFQALRTQNPVPSLRVLLGDTRKTDLAPRFRRSTHSEGIRSTAREFSGNADRSAPSPYSGAYTAN